MSNQDDTKTNTNNTSQGRTNPTFTSHRLDQSIDVTSDPTIIAGIEYPAGPEFNSGSSKSSYEAEDGITAIFMWILKLDQPRYERYKGQIWRGLNANDQIKDGNIKALSVDDLSDLGITDLKDRKYLFARIQRLTKDELQNNQDPPTPPTPPTPPAKKNENHDQNLISSGINSSLSALKKSSQDASISNYGPSAAEAKEEEKLQMTQTDLFKQESIRNAWKQGSSVEIYSESQAKWNQGKITKIFNDDEGEWLVIKYDGSTTEIQRFNEYVRPPTKLLKQISIRNDNDRNESKQENKLDEQEKQSRILEEHYTEQKEEISPSTGSNNEIATISGVSENENTIKSKPILPSIREINDIECKQEMKQSNQSDTAKQDGHENDDPNEHSTEIYSSLSASNNSSRDASISNYGAIAAEAKEEEEEELHVTQTDLFIQQSIRNAWKVGSSVEIHSESQAKWNEGKITKIINDEEGECLVIEYDGSTKEIQRFNQCVRPTKEQMEILKELSIRNAWKRGSFVEVYREAPLKWIPGRIIKIFNDEEGEWLVVNYGFYEREIQRFNEYIQPTTSKIVKASIPKKTFKRFTIYTRPKDCDENKNDNEDDYDEESDLSSTSSKMTSKIHQEQVELTAGNKLKKLNKELQRNQSENIELEQESAALEYNSKIKKSIDAQLTTSQNELDTSLHQLQDPLKDQ